MNIKIIEEEYEFLINKPNERFLIGSKLYGTDNEKSDTDMLIVYESFHEESDLYYPNFH